MSVADVIVRPATPADLSSIGRLGALLVKLHHEFDPERFIAPMPNLDELYGSFIGKQLELPGVVVFVAEEQGEIAGYAYGTVEGYDYMALRGPAGVIQDVVVAPVHRGRGIGRDLLEAVFAELVARGSPRVVLSTAERNENAQRLFEKAGFRRTMIEMTREVATTSASGRKG